MKILVTGATGFIGSNVVRELLRKEYEVRVFLRKKAVTKNIEGLNVEVKYGDVLDEDSIKKAMKGCQCVIHTASLYTFWYPASEFLYRVNVEGTENILKHALRMELEKVIFTSTAMTCGVSYHKEEVRDEKSLYNLKEKEDSYVHSKYLAEKVCSEYVKKGLDVVIVNPTFPLGEGDVRPSPIGFIFLSFLNGRWTGFLKGGGNFVNVKDVASGHILAMEKGKKGERYILGGKNLYFQELFEQIALTLHIPKRRFGVPVFFGKAEAFIQEVKTVFNTGSPPFTRSTFRLWNRFLFYSSHKAEEELGYSPGSLDEGIREGARWFLENGYVKKRMENRLKEWV